MLWDNGVYDTEEIKSIASLFFDGANLRAVLKIIEKVENGSHSPGTTTSRDAWGHVQLHAEKKKRAA
jgi:hypothetical protein